MKKTILLFLCVLLAALTLNACDPGGFSFGYESELLEHVAGVELIDYKNDSQKHFKSWVPDHSGELKDFDVRGASVLEKLPAEKLPAFLHSLRTADVLSAYYAYDSPKGECIRVNYENGDFLILSCQDGSYAGYIGFFSADGAVKRFIGCFSSYESYEALRMLFDGSNDTAIRGSRISRSPCVESQGRLKALKLEKSIIFNCK